MSNKIEDETVTESCGNVFDDLGLANPEEMLAKSTLAIMIRRILKQRKLTQTQAAKIFGTHQTQISRLNTGKGVDSMSFDLLLVWLTKLDHNVTVTVRHKSQSQDHAEIKVAV
ncbi:MAG: helix-turn-helix domain-containing protein [Candidatus Anammoxibacter sp.]